MNEASITEAIGVVTTNWSIIIPWLFFAAINLAWIGSIVGRLFYKYVFEEEASWSFGKWLVSKLFKDADFPQGRGEDYYHSTRNRERPWYLMDCGAEGSGDFFPLYFMVSWAIPFCVFAVGAVLHETPSWVAWALLSTWGALFTTRLAVRAGRKASQVLKALDTHKKDVNAHKGEYGHSSTHLAK